MKITYLSWLRSEVGKSCEELKLPQNIKTLSELVNWLCEKGNNYERAFSNLSVINVSLNNQFLRNWNDTQIKDTDQISFFSPMAGG